MHANSFFKVFFFPNKFCIGKFSIQHFPVAEKQSPDTTQFNPLPFLSHYFSIIHKFLFFTAVCSQVFSFRTVLHILIEWPLYCHKIQAWGGSICVYFSFCICLNFTISSLLPTKLSSNLPAHAASHSFQEWLCLSESVEYMSSTVDFRIIVSSARAYNTRVEKQFIQWHNMLVQCYQWQDKTRSGVVHSETVVAKTNWHQDLKLLITVRY